jgi:hypothetical protein
MLLWFCSLLCANSDAWIKKEPQPSPEPPVEADIRYFHTGDESHRCHSALLRPASKRQVTDDILSVFGGVTLALQDKQLSR